MSIVLRGFVCGLAGWGIMQAIKWLAARRLARDLAKYQEPDE